MDSKSLFGVLFRCRVPMDRFVILDMWIGLPCDDRGEVGSCRLEVKLRRYPATDKDFNHIKSVSRITLMDGVDRFPDTLFGCRAFHHRMQGGGRHLQCLSGTSGTGNFALHKVNTCKMWSRSTSSMLLTRFPIMMEFKCSS